MERKLKDLLARITPADKNVMAKTQARLDSLTKPPGSLGVLECLAKKIAGITGNPLPALPKKTCILMAGDHGVVAEGVSAFPQEVTPQMVLNFANGGAAINVLSRHAEADLILVDIGVAADLPDLPGLVKKKVAYGTKNMTKGPAMTKDEALQALLTGIEVAENSINTGSGLIGTGEMGIGNTTPSSAIIAFYSGLPVEDVVGKGTGIEDEKLKLKADVIRKAIEINKPNKNDALDVLAKIGGLEIAGLAGVMLACAANKVPVMIDGFISGAAAIIASRLCPDCQDYFIGSHLSQEPGHQVMLNELNIKPMLVMEMRLGEGTGAALGMNMVDAAIKILNQMATFEDAGVSNK